MDEAFRAIKMITNKKIWGNLAKMCVKSQVGKFNSSVPIAWIPMKNFLF